MRAREFRVGEIVDVTIRGARVVEVDDDPAYVMLRTGGDVQTLDVATDDPAVTIEPVTPDATESGR